MRSRIGLQIIRRDGGRQKQQDPLRIAVYRVKDLNIIRIGIQRFQMDDVFKRVTVKISLNFVVVIVSND